MPTITKILPQKRRPNRRNIYLDGVFSFGLNDNVVARFRLREGLKISDDQVTQIAQGEVRQECFDDAMKCLQRRMHSRAELRRKLIRREFADAIIEGILDDLTRLGYLDDAKFATAKAQSAADRKQHGRRRAYMELMKSGVKKEVANKVLEVVYSQTDSTVTARALVEKKMPAMKRLDPIVARRRLAGMLMRRGFDYETISPVIDEALRARDDR